MSVWNVRYREYTAHLIDITLPAQNERMCCRVWLAEQYQVDESEQGDASEKDDTQSIHDEFHDVLSWDAVVFK